MPAFAATPRCSAVTVSAANTARDGTGTIATVFTAGASGSRIDEIVVKATDNPADSIVTLFIHTGSTYFLFDEVDLSDPAAASTTVTGYRTSLTYTNLILPTGYSLRAAITVALTAGVMNVIAFGGDF